MGLAERTFFTALSDLGVDWRKQKFDFLTNRFELQANEKLHGIFTVLGGDLSAWEMKRCRPLICDGYLYSLKRLIEFDELQHFTSARRRSLTAYPTDHIIGFDLSIYEKLCVEHGAKAEKSGPSGYRAPKAEFPFAGGRHCQRALFDAARDLLPPQNGLGATIRFNIFDVPATMKGDVETTKRQLSPLWEERCSS